MKKTLVLIATTLMATSAFALTPALQKAITSYKNDNVRITVQPLATCHIEGSVQIKVEVKTPSYNYMTNNHNDYLWETVKTVNLNPAGEPMDSCRK